MRSVFLSIFCIFLLTQIIHSEELENSTMIADNTTSSPNLQTELGTREDSCLQGCQAQQPAQSTFKITVFIVSFLCGFLLLGLLTSIFCTNKRIAKCTKKLCRKNKELVALRQKYDVVSSGLMSESQFEEKCQVIVRLFQKSPSKSVFGYKRQNQQNLNFCQASLRLTKENAFHSFLQIEGEDRLGQWCGSGSILCQSEQIFIWFTQQYNDISKQWKEDTRIFTSVKVNPETITGKWFSNKEQQNETSSGSWVLFDPNIYHMAISSQSIHSIQESN